MTEPFELTFSSVEARPVMAREVVVAFEVVLLSAVKFWRVEDPETRRFAKVPVPEPVMFAPLTLPAVVRLPVNVSAPPIPVVNERFVDEANEAKKLVVVALVPVAFKKVKFWRVEEPEV